MPRTTLLRRLLSATVSLTTFVILAGCSGPVKNTGYLDDYTSFNSVDEDVIKFRLYGEEDHSLDEYFPTREELEEMDPEYDALEALRADGIEREDLKPVLFVIAQPTWSAMHRYEESEKEDAILFTIRERMYRYLLRQYPHPVRVRYAFVPNDPRLQDYRVLTVESVVTDVNTGIGWLRYMVGYGAGTSILQIEGHIYEGDPYNPEKTIAEFALREEHAGYPNQFLNPSVMKSSYTLRYAAEEAIGKLTRIIREHVPAAVLRADNIEPASKPKS